MPYIDCLQPYLSLPYRPFRKHHRYEGLELPMISTSQNCKLFIRHRQEDQAEPQSKHPSSPSRPRPNDPLSSLVFRDSTRQLLLATSRTRTRNHTTYPEPKDARQVLVDDKKPVLRFGADVRGCAAKKIGESAIDTHIEQRYLFQARRLVSGTVQVGDGSSMVLSM